MKKIRLKRLIALTCAFAALMLVLSGCGKEKNEASAVTTIEVWTNAGSTKTYMTEKIDKWNETVGKEEGIKIDYTVYGADYVSVYELAMENDQAPDLLSISGSKVDYVAKGDIIPLSDFPGGQEFIDNSGSAVINGVNMFDGKTYFINVSNTTVGLIYNVDLFKKAGIVDKDGNALPPATWDEVRSDAKKITALSDKVYGISFPFKWASFYNWVVRHPFSASFEYLDNVNWDDLSYDFSNLKKPFEFLQQIKKDGSVFPGVENMDNDTQRAQFAAGNIGMYFGASWDVGVLGTQFVATCDWDVAELPVFDVNDKYLQNGSIGHSMCFSKAAKDKDPEKLMEVFKFFYSEEEQKEEYKNEFTIPANGKYTEDVDMSGTSKQWQSFGKLSAISRPNLPEPLLKIEGDNASDITYKIWSGNVTDIDEAIEGLNERYTDALRRGVKDGSIDPKLYDCREQYNMKR